MSEHEDALTMLASSVITNRCVGCRAAIIEEIRAAIVARTPEHLADSVPLAVVHDVLDGFA